MKEIKTKKTYERPDLGADTIELTIVPKTIKKRIMNKNNLTEMKRKDCTAPTMMVVVMQHTQLLVASGTEANRSGYGTANYGVTDELDSDGSWEWE